MPRRSQKYTWNDVARRWRDARGRFVPAQDVRRAIRRTDVAHARRLRGIATTIADARDLTSVRNTLIAELRAQHAIATATAHGGWSRVPPSAWLETARGLKREYRHVDRLLSLVASGEINPRSRAFLARVESYGGNARKRRADAERAIVTRDADAWEGRWIRGIAEHCPGCLAQPRAWRDVSRIPRIGSQQCKWFCKCMVEYRRKRRPKK